MKNKFYLIVLGFVFGPFINSITFSQTNNNSEYTLVIDGMDWGPTASKVIIGLNTTAKSIEYTDYAVSVERSHTCAEVPPAQAKGNRTVIFAYPSDNKGHRLEEGNYATLVLAVAPNQPIGSMFQYSQKAACRGNQWVNYKFEISNTKTSQIWNRENGRIMPIADYFDLSGKFEYEPGKSLTYASFVPNSTTNQINSIKKVPIWFIQAKDDKVTDPKLTALPVYERLKKAGSKNVHFSYFDHVTDITGLFGGENYYYNGHWSWIYSHANQVFKELDGSYVKLNGRPTSLMEWLAAQSKK